jgi:hypothetical protein
MSNIVQVNLSEQAVIFADPNLEQAIREAIPKPSGPISTTDLLPLTFLDAISRYIRRLAGIQYCTNLRVLYLAWNQILDVSPLAGLANLTALDLAENHISSNDATIAALRTRGVDVYA